MKSTTKSKAQAFFPATLGANIKHTPNLCADITMTSEYVAYVIVTSAHTT